MEIIIESLNRSGRFHTFDKFDGICYIADCYIETENINVKQRGYNEKTQDAAIINSIEKALKIASCKYNIKYVDCLSHFKYSLQDFLDNYKFKIKNTIKYGEKTVYVLIGYEKNLIRERKRRFYDKFIDFIRR